MHAHSTARSENSESDKFEFDEPPEPLACKDLGEAGAELKRQIRHVLQTELRTSTTIQDQPEAIHQTISDVTRSQLCTAFGSKFIQEHENQVWPTQI